MVQAVINLGMGLVFYPTNSPYLFLMNANGQPGSWSAQ